MLAGSLETTCHLKIESVERFSGDISKVRDELEAVGQGQQVLIVCQAEAEVQRLAEVFGSTALAQQGRLGYHIGSLKAGFRLVSESISMVGSSELFHRTDLRRPAQRRLGRAIDTFLDLRPGDLVVHADHGIGRFLGLQAITAAGAPHDCLEIEYHGGDKLFLPVENIELLSRYGSDESDAVLDRLGGVAWQARKARLKKRIRDIAGSLIKVAAERELKEAPVLAQPEGMYDEFCARFPYDETDDQATSIEAVIEDLTRGRPMDRLICGDVGFGKTEVALRAAFIAVLGGKQVAVVVPTTLLARQHYKTFAERFQGFPLTVAQASRLISAKDLADVREGLKTGKVDIVIGTHALLAKNIEFANLGLLIVDEEQHFGVSHKERLKQLKADVHVLTLTATPIPRTLQLALTGVREMSVIATPPVDRLAVRTFITPFDPVTIRVVTAGEVRIDDLLRIDLDPEGVHGFADILDVLFAHGDEFEFRIVFEFLPDRFGDTDTARAGKFFETGGQVDGIAINLALLRNHIAEVHAARR